MNEKVKKILENNLWEAATVCSKGFPNVVPVGFKAVLDDGKLAIGDVFLKQTLENIEANHRIAANNESPERHDHLAGIPIQQDQPCGRNVKGQPKQRRNQQQRRKYRELQGLHIVNGNHDNGQRQGNIERQQQVQQKWRHGDDHHNDDCHNAQRQNYIAKLIQFADDRVFISHSLSPTYSHSDIFRFNR